MILKKINFYIFILYKMKIITINYQKNFDKNWYVYHQTIKIDKELKQKYNNRIKYLKNKINKKIKNDKTFTYDEWKILSYTFNLKNWVNYMLWTGLLEFWKLVSKLWINNDRLKLFRNTIIIVK